jgi:hypothetical protein
MKPLTSYALAVVVVVGAGVLLASCSFVVTIDDAPHRIGVYTNTPAETGTPTQTATHTQTAAPTATHTVTHTNTPTYTATPVKTASGTPQPPFSTPTQETTIAPTPTATVEACEVYTALANAPNINIRTLPSTAAQVVDVFPPGARTRPLAQYTGDARFTWYKLWWFGSTAWMAGVDAVQIAGDCEALPNENPFDVARLVGFKTVPGAKASTLVEFANRLPANTRAVAFTVQDTELANALHNAGVFVVFVPWTQFPGDCPNVSMSPYNSAVNRVQYVQQQVGAARFDMVVLTNECAWPSAAWYAEWAFVALDECEARGWRCITHVWNTGAPDLDWLPALDGLHCAIAQRGHGYGANIYPYYNVPLMTRDAMTQYTTWRHELIQPMMQCAPEWYVTELAPNGGGWSPRVDDTAAYINATRGAFRAVGVWYTGNALSGWPAAAWSDAQVVELAGRVQ